MVELWRDHRGLTLHGRPRHGGRLAAPLALDDCSPLLPGMSGHQPETSSPRASDRQQLAAAGEPQTDPCFRSTDQLPDKDLAAAQKYRRFAAKRGAARP
jgi:hypothetical protein